MSKEWSTTAYHRILYDLHMQGFLSYEEMEQIKKESTDDSCKEIEKCFDESGGENEPYFRIYFSDDDYSYTTNDRSQAEKLRNHCYFTEIKKSDLDPMIDFFLETL